MPTEQQLELAGGGQLLRWEPYLERAEADALHSELTETLLWQQRSLRMFGRSVLEPRLTVWMGDPEAHYTYSGRAHSPKPWCSALEGLRRRLEGLLDTPFNSVLANLYRDQRDSMGWHADDEPELGINPTIASISLGETRRFWLKHSEATTQRLELGHGGLLVMRGTTQHHWKHSVPKESRPCAPRINLTFRWIHPSAQ